MGLGIFQALAGDTVFCSQLRHFALTVPLSTQVYKWVPASCWENLTNCGGVTCDGLAGLEVNFSAHLQNLTSKIFFHQQTSGETTSKFSPNVWETWMILTRKRLLVDIFLTRSLSKSLAFCELASVNFEPWTNSRNTSSRFILPKPG